MLCKKDKEQQYIEIIFTFFDRPYFEVGVTRDGQSDHGYIYVPWDLY